MTMARKNQIILSETPFYHCTSRCVRGAFLCGEDPESGKNYHHRKQWILDRIALAESSFAIDICAYAVMNNHFHIVLSVDERACAKLSDREVAERWLKVYRGNNLVKHWMDRGCEALTKGENAIVAHCLKSWRGRLASISWFMRVINENIARRANREDKCKGHFWDGRFKSQALLDEAALLACMAYVDLNPVRAKLAQTPEDSSFTSIQSRIRDKVQQGSNCFIDISEQSTKPQLMPFMKKALEEHEPSMTYLPYLETDYFKLVDWTGRAIRSDKPGFVPERVKPILERLNICSDEWVKTIPALEKRFHQSIGIVDRMRAWCESVGSRWCKGISSSKALFLS